LRKLDLIIDCPMESIGNKTPLENILFTQPGMRYCQAQSLVFSLMKDETFKQYDVAKRDEICRLILEEVRGRMLEEIVLIETIKTLPSHRRAIKLIFDIGEYDMVIADSKSLTCEIYEIKHSDQVHKSQYRYLVDEQKCNATEHEYGKITGKYVLYRGENVQVEGIQYLNVVDYLERFPH
jgi:hypothetical protein